MRIAIVTESFLPTINGVTNSVLRILDFLDAYGHEALVIAPQATGAPSSYLDYRIKHVPSFNPKKFIPMGFPKLSLKHFIEGFQPDVIHLASPALLGGYASRVARELGIPSVSVYQTDVSGFAKHYGFALGSESFNRALARIHSNTTRTLAPSTSAMSILKKLGTDNVYLWQRGVDLVRFHPEKRDENLRKSWGSADKKIVGYVGRLAAEKSLEDLTWIQEREDLQLVIVGDGPNADKLKTKLPRAKFLGHQSGEDLAKCHASFDFFIHTGKYETFCQSIQEALSSGVPVIAPRSGGPIDLIHDGINGMFYSLERPWEINGALDQLLSSDQDSLSFSARESVLHRDWESINKELIDHYRAAIQTKNSSLSTQGVA
jgi:phosphatidylinositol alpha 1,6-mannosyltransferase